ncbi:hypothetical protein [Sphingomonas alpina]|uniref:Uncharacterized protein n=1 Tax=Sphingomonas alpina TaxID=653931 RepID=A0A7H0LEW0_9SPHN|nr:hypothetical protein [Sphingomonas alpina]QNQ08213.1 hypothetical protein H3Z74_15745 [Sphingomonas alpina]
MTIDAIHASRATAMIGAALLALIATGARAQDVLPAASPAPPPCRMVGDAPSAAGVPQFIRIDPAAATRMAEIGLDRAGIFARMAETSIPETMGCWAMPAGNFDSQLISVGMAQWNFGTGSLQPVLQRWRDGFSSGGRFKRALKALAPTYGKLLFSKDCRVVPVRDKCRAGILAAEDASGRLNPVIATELTAIFESDAMLQVQTDTYIELLDAVRLDLLRVFPAGQMTLRKVRWAIDTRVQQGFLPGDEDVARLRTKLAAMPEVERWPRLRAIIAWYKALAETIDQDGVGRDHQWNVQRWACMIDAGAIDAEQYELLSLTFLRSRTAIGNSGRWQALTFERRAKIILGVGSVSGKRDGECAAQPAAS